MLLDMNHNALGVLGRTSSSGRPDRCAHFSVKSHQREVRQSNFDSAFSQGYISIYGI